MTIKLPNGVIEDQPRGAIVRLGAWTRHAPSRVDALAFVPHRDVLAVAARQGVFRTHHVDLWDATTDEHLGTIASHDDPICAIAFSPDGAMLATNGFDEVVQCWDTRTGRRLAVLSRNTVANSLAVSPDGRLLAAGGGGFVEVFDLHAFSRLRRRRIQTTARGFSRWLPDSIHVAVANQNSVDLWNTRTGELANSSKVHGMPSSVDRLAVSTNGRHIAATDRAPGTGRPICLLEIDVARGIREAHRLPQSVDLTPAAVDFSWDGSLLATTDYGGFVRVWDVANKSLLWESQAHLQTASELAFSHDGHTLASGGCDRVVRLSDSRTGTEIRPLAGHRGAVSSVLFAVGGSTLLTGALDPAIGIWTVPTGLKRGSFNEHSTAILCLANDPAGRLVASSSAGPRRHSIAGPPLIRIWDPHTGRQHAAIGTDKKSVYTIAFTPDGRFLAENSFPDNVVRLWDVDTRLAAGQWEFDDDVSRFAFSGDGKWLLALQPADRTIAFVDLKSNERLVMAERFAGLDLPIAISPDSREAACAVLPNSIGVVDIAKRCQKALLGGHSDYIRCLTYSRDGRFLASASDDRTWRVWDALNGDCLAIAGGHYGALDSIAFSPDGKYLATGGGDGTAVLWDFAAVLKQYNPMPPASSRT